MQTWGLYRKRGATLMRPYIVGESLDGISVSDVDIPKEGDMIAQNPNNPKDRWLVAKEYFEKYYELEKF